MHKAQVLKAAEDLWTNLNPTYYPSKDFSFINVKAETGTSTLLAYVYKEPKGLVWGMLKISELLASMKEILVKLKVSHQNINNFMVVFPVEWLTGKWITCSLKMTGKGHYTLEVYDPAGFTSVQDKKLWLQRAEATLASRFGTKNDTVVLISNISRENRSKLLELNSASLVLDCLNSFFRTAEYPCTINPGNATKQLQENIDKLNSLLGSDIDPIELIQDLEVVQQKKNIFVITGPVSEKTLTPTTSVNTSPNNHSSTSSSTSTRISTSSTPTTMFDSITPLNLEPKEPLHVQKQSETIDVMKPQVQITVPINKFVSPDNFYQFESLPRPYYYYEPSLLYGREYITGASHIHMKSSEYEGDLSFHKSSLIRGPLGTEVTNVALAGACRVNNLVNPGFGHAMILGNPIPGLGLTYLEYNGTFNKYGIPHSESLNPLKPSRLKQVGYLYLVIYTKDGFKRQCILDGIFCDGKLPTKSKMAHTYTNNVPAFQINEHMLNAAFKHYYLWLQEAINNAWHEQLLPNFKLENEFSVETSFEGERFGERLKHGIGRVFIGANVQHMCAETYLLYNGEISAMAPHGSGALEIITIDRTNDLPVVNYLPICKGEFNYGVPSQLTEANIVNSKEYNPFYGQIVLHHFLHNNRKLSLQLNQLDILQLNQLREKAFLSTGDGCQLFGEQLYFEAQKSKVLSNINSGPYATSPGSAAAFTPLYRNRELPPMPPMRQVMNSHLPDNVGVFMTSPKF